LGENRLEQKGHGHNKNVLALALGALGVVYGDIGTSPLYALRECFAAEHGIAMTPENILGVLSLIFWTIFLTVCVKYMIFILRADNRGEGGILSLMALAIGDKELLDKKWILTAIGVFGAALLYGDGAITPAISVLSAVEGLKVVTPVFEHYVVPITMVVISGLFFVQFVGTAFIGIIFGPVMLVWFLVLALLGVGGLVQNPQVLEAFNPYHAVDFFITNGWTGFFVLGSVFLVVTGGEALYADMGHFGKKPIRLAWFIIALPALVLNYLGQGALLLSKPEAIENPFYFLSPDWALIPMVALSTLATVIASQALISGVYSITRQAVQLGFWPRVSIVHTSSREIGQIYIPTMNWLLWLGVIWLVFSFKSSSNLASAYGIAVTGTMLITTVLAYVVARRLWGWSMWQAVAVFGFFAIIDLSFFATNIAKVAHGGWVPLAIGVVIYVLMSTWRQGRRVLAQSLKEKTVPLTEFCAKIEAEPPLRVPGNAIYMSSDPWGVPVPLLHNLKHNKVMHETIAILTISTKEVPFVGKANRVKIEEISKSFYRILVSYGFMEIPKMKHILEACRAEGLDFHVSDTTFVLGRESIIASGDKNMPIWRERLFAIMSRNAERPTAFFKIPPNQVIEVGIQVEI
jgi:KUP system potassium uptake protein